MLVGTPVVPLPLPGFTPMGMPVHLPVSLQGPFHFWPYRQSVGQCVTAPSWPTTPTMYPGVGTWPHLVTEGWTPTSQPAPLPVFSGALLANMWARVTATDSLLATFPLWVDGAEGRLMHRMLPTPTPKLPFFIRDFCLFSSRGLNPSHSHRSGPKQEQIRAISGRSPLGH